MIWRVVFLWERIKIMKNKQSILKPHAIINKPKLEIIVKIFLLIFFDYKFIIKIMKNKQSCFLIVNNDKSTVSDISFLKNSNKNVL